MTHRRDFLILYLITKCRPIAAASVAKPKVDTALLYLLLLCPQAPHGRSGFVSAYRMIFTFLGRKRCIFIMER